MKSYSSKYLLSIVDKLKSKKIGFYLLWETAIFAWGISNNGHLQKIDVLVSDSTIDDKFKLVNNLYYKINDPDFKEARFWTSKSLHLSNVAEITLCEQYDCYALAPEVQLQKMQYFPEKNQYAEDIAKLAAAVYVDELNKEDIENFTKYVRS